jgi:hypothetical protein
MSSAEPGKIIVAEIEKFIKSSRFVLPVLSPEFLSDKLAMFATVLALSYDLEMRRRSVVPLIFRPVNCPLILSIWNGLDFTDPDEWQVNIDRLCAEIKRPLPGQASE